MSPYDPIAMLDEIQRLVPGYDISRLGVLAGQDEHTQLVQITGETGVGTSGADSAVERHAVYLGHAGPVFGDAEHGDGALSRLSRRTRKWRRIDRKTLFGFSLFARPVGRD